MGRHRGSVRVEAGNFTMAGNLQGSLSLAIGSNATISGQMQGSVHLSPRCTVVVSGILDGSAHVEPDATLIVAPGARYAGSLHNDGTTVVRGVVGGSRTGDDEFRLEDQGYVKKAVIKDGVHVYDW